jgi:glycosyltransferase involved in cell wall biosynthesis
MRATFVYPNSRRELLAGIEDGEEPDSTLHGALYLGEHGIDVRFHDPILTRRALPAPLDRVVWNLRELTTPYELGRTDVVVTPLAALLPLAARGRRLPVVAINFGLNLIWRRASRARRVLLRSSLRSAARVISRGESQRSELVASAGLDAARVVTMPIPVDTEFFNANPEKPRAEPDGDARTVVTVGKDLARDYGTFVEAVRPLAVDATIVAHPRNLERPELSANVTLRSGLSFPELRELYAGAACIVLPQRSEGYVYGSEGGGLTALLEAMAMSRPIVASDRAILHDYVTDGVEALLVPPEDPSALRAAIERVLGDQELSRSLGSAARARVESGHTSRGFAARLAPLLRSVV